MTRASAKLTMAVVGLIMGIVVVAMPSPALAIPDLQLYLEGSSYDPATATWVFVGDHFKLWVLGDTQHFGTIFHVKLTVAYPTTAGNGTITITPDLASPGLLPPPGDPLPLPPAPLLVTNPSSAASPSNACNGTYGTVGTIPCLGSGKPLAQHGEYGAGVQWIEYLLGDFSASDSPIGDYITVAPPATFPDMGQINVYKVDVSGFTAGTLLHFDAFDHVVQTKGRNRFIFAPFSHDALDSPSVPEPSSLLLLGSGVSAFIWLRLRKPRT